MPIRLEDLPGLFNRFEVVLWVGMGVVLAVRARRAGTRRTRTLMLLAAAVLLAFGGSDFAEAMTGDRWWSPWWLLLWKGACVASLAGIALAAIWGRQARERTGRSGTDP